MDGSPQLVGPVFGPHPEPGSVRFWVVVSDPDHVGDNVIVVHSDQLDWGHEGWAATLRRVGPSTFEGWWGANYPEFDPGAVPSGTHRIVLAISGEADGWVGWQANLHENAGEEETLVHVMPAVETLVKLWVTLSSPPDYAQCVVSTSRPVGWSPTSAAPAPRASSPLPAMAGAVVAGVVAPAPPAANANAVTPITAAAGATFASARRLHQLPQ